MTGSAPLPLLGTFHEFSLAVRDVAAAVEFYERLGFRHATTTDAFLHPYGVLTDGRVFIGIHGRTGPSPALTFVRPDLARSLAAFEDAGIELGTLHVGTDEFNQVAFATSDGQEIAVLEARTYSPVDRRALSPSLCGEFAEVSLPATDFASAQAFWEKLGFVGAEEEDSPYVHLPLTSDQLEIAFHRPRLCEVPLLVFQSGDAGASLQRMGELGYEITRPRGTTDVGVIEAPGDCALLVMPATG
ncbi:MAG: VOC family protein [Proteobacteria bacterium]|nr:VOC family protein [Pseudomonadota bacterium]